MNSGPDTESIKELDALRTQLLRVILDMNETERKRARRYLRWLKVKQMIRTRLPFRLFAFLLSRPKF